MSSASFSKCEHYNIYIKLPRKKRQLNFFERSISVKDYLTEMFTDTMLSYYTKKYSTALNDSERMEKCTSYFDSLRQEDPFTVSSTQILFDSKGLNDFEATTLDGKPVFRIVKLGLFNKVKVCYYITRTKDKVTADYLKLIYHELIQQTIGVNVFSASDYKN